MMMINLNIETEKSCLLFTFLDSNETTINPTAKDNADSVLNDKKISFDRMFDLIDLELQK